MILKVIIAIVVAVSVALEVGLIVTNKVEEAVFFGIIILVFLPVLIQKFIISNE